MSNTISLSPIFLSYSSRLIGVVRLAMAAVAVMLFCGSDWLQFRGSDNTSVCGGAGKRDITDIQGIRAHIGNK
jgi:hypothetical protein